MSFYHALGTMLSSSITEETQSEDLGIYIYRERTAEDSYRNNYFVQESVCLDTFVIIESWQSNIRPKGKELTGWRKSVEIIHLHFNLESVKLKVPILGKWDSEIGQDTLCFIYIKSLYRHLYNPSTWEVEAGGQWVRGQPELHSKTLY
jgi:hypothetical protein